jgi:(p)ppGpp synthase/HD superfamily hydrolase
MALQVDDLYALAKRFGYAGEHDLYASIGGCDLAIERVLRELLATYEGTQLPTIRNNGRADLPVTGAGSLNRSLALCCQPQPGEDIVGYIIDSGDTVEVHQSDCRTLLDKLEDDQRRLVVVKWGRAYETHSACMSIYAHDRPFLLRDVWNIVFDEGINVSDVDVQVNRAQDATIQICIDVEDWLQFHRVLARIDDLPGTIHVRRTLSVTTRHDPHEGPRLARSATTKRRNRLRVPLLSWLLGS